MGIQSFSRARPGRVYLWPTKYGWTFLFVLLGMVVGSANYGNNLGFLVAFVFTGMALASALASRGLIRGTTVDGGHAAPVFAGEEACFAFSVRATAPNAVMTIAFHEEQTVTISLPVPPDAARARLCAPAARRGLLRPGPVRISTSFPLGLFTAWCWRDFQGACLVYPAPYAGALPLRHFPGGRGYGASGGPGTEEFKGLREYAPGDALQRIAWKASMRGQGLFTKEFEGLQGGGYILDYAAFHAFGNEERLSRLCRMALQAHAEGAPFGLRLPGREIPPATGQGHLHACLKALALFAPLAEKDRG